TITWLEESEDGDAEVAALRKRLDTLRGRAPAPVVGFTGTGGAGKSSVVDELLTRYRLDHPDRRIGLLLVDPTRRRTGGALVGDRIRMNAVEGDPVFARSLATRRAHLALSRTVSDALRVLQAAGFDLLVVETAGIGQSDSEIVDLVDHSVYVMTPEYGAPTQLEKIDMLDLADLVVLNKSDRHGAEDALRDVRKQWRRNHAKPAAPDAEVPVFATIARRWNDPGVGRLDSALCARLGESPLRREEGVAAAEGAIVPSSRRRYLAEIAESVRAYHARSDAEAEAASNAQALGRALESVGAVPEAALLRERHA